MLAAARVLAPEDVMFDVARRLFGREPFLDFAGADAAGRAALLATAYSLFDIALERNMSVSSNPPTLALGI